MFADSGKGRMKCPVKGGLKTAGKMLLFGFEFAFPTEFSRSELILFASPCRPCNTKSFKYKFQKFVSKFREPAGKSIVWQGESPALPGKSSFLEGGN